MALICGSLLGYLVLTVALGDIRIMAPADIRRCMELDRLQRMNEEVPEPPWVQEFRDSVSVRRRPMDASRKNPAHCCKIAVEWDCQQACEELLTTVYPTEVEVERYRFYCDTENARDEWQWELARCLEKGIRQKCCKIL